MGKILLQKEFVLRFTLSRKYSTDFYIYSFCILIVAIALAVFSLREPHVHFQIFIKAAEDMAQRVNPYGHSLGSGGGYATLWLYSPTTAMFFYPFTLLPIKLANFLYLLSSCLVFFIGLYSLAKALKGESLGLGGTGFFLLLLMTEFLSSLQAAKIEIIFCGVTMLAMSWIVDARERKTLKYVLSAALMALLTNSKFLPIPVIGLFLIYMLATQLRVALSWLLFFVISFILISAYPLLFLEWDFFKVIHVTWFQSLAESLEMTWQGYPSFYNFLRSILGFPATLTQLKIFGLVVAMLLALYMLWISKCEKNSLHNNMRRGLLLSLVLGFAYTLLFFPMSQSSAYVLATPLYVWFYVRGGPRFVLFLFWFFSAFLYSDLSPELSRSFVRGQGVKAAALFLLALYIIRVEGRERGQALAKEIQNP